MTKKILLAIWLLAGMCGLVSAQLCVGDSIYLTPPANTTPGFSPPCQDLPCINNGSYVSDTIYFTNYSTLNSAAIDYVTIDSITNLPGGLCWMPDTPGTTYGPGQNTALYISGWCGSPSGQYKLNVYIDAGIAGNSIQIYGEKAEAVFGLRYYLVVNCAGAPCPAIDTVNGKTMTFIPDSNSNEQCVSAGISEPGKGLGSVSIAPNPFTSAATLSLVSNVSGTYTLRIADMPGAVVSERKINIAAGQNDIPIERKGLAPGVYILSIGGDMMQVSRKLVIE